MDDKVLYTTKLPDNFDQVYQLYEALGWNSLHFTVGELEKMCLQSWYAMYAYHDQQLVGIGRVISDGVITGVICGVGIHPSFQSIGIGKNIINRLVAHCEQNRVIPQLMCVENLQSYYEKLGFRKFTIGMTKIINR